jgi:hypothetical protein
VVGRQPYAPAGFTPRNFPGTHFWRLSQPLILYVAKCELFELRESPDLEAEKIRVKKFKDFVFSN